MVQSHCRSRMVIPATMKAKLQLPLWAAEDQKLKRVETRPLLFAPASVVCAFLNSASFRLWQSLDRIARSYGKLPHLIFGSYEPQTITQLMQIVGKRWAILFTSIVRVTNLPSWQKSGWTRGGHSSIFAICHSSPAGNLQSFYRHVKQPNEKQASLPIG